MVEIKENGEWEINSGGGLSRLEWYAGMALMGMFSNENSRMYDPRIKANICFDQAKTMIEEAEKRGRG